MNSIYEQTKEVALELIVKANLKKGSLVVVGCSTSEVNNSKIGTNGSVESAGEIVRALNEVFTKNGIDFAAQCCEHLNRAIVLDKEVAQKNNFEIVSVVPYPFAGGSFAATVYQNMSNPVVVEEIKADAGIDIGNTFIGMHLKKVAVIIRLENNIIGSAKVNAAYTRPKYIGGERAKYK